MIKQKYMKTPTKKVVKLPSKPTTKRDKHFYLMGMDVQFKSQREEWNSRATYAGASTCQSDEERDFNKEWEELELPQSRKDLGDHHVPLKVTGDPFAQPYPWKAIACLLVVLISVCIILAHPYITNWVNKQ